MISALAIMNVTAGDIISVSIVKQYDDTTFILPNKAIEKKIKCLAVKNAKYDFTKKLIKALDSFQEKDYGNNVFTVMLKYYGKGISIVVIAQDILDNDSLKYFGDIMIGRKHFVLIENEDNHDLLVTYFKKASNSVIFQRLFEKTDNIVINEPSSYDALYNERSQVMETYEYIINGEDLKNKTTTKVTTTLNNDKDDSDDAFKLDVELFE